MNGKTVLITGGNSGLGLETVRDLAMRGAKIIMASRRIDVAHRVRGCSSIKEITKLFVNYSNLQPLFFR